ncbi:hypothetical protein PF005_g23832 [Phytophthora fragariae]|uniref:Uncharacterized protein n=2 Tax=Phytophthora TaxID=4783 RepID=A0A6A3IHT4_9STRA|nr:hypothetical protein PF003_g20583 [Phytophthora fragariae]KAE8984475.1 hypothetical protein PR001_g23164 [Phytophthora rubi]KAE8925241.1 hypothetical protein PF009_g24550 [Phytophthora fragariae]KAE8980058.1 hypothetical protein PF011_g22594 [Phytophthora fragariae]KAE9000972.1 hypothetical protein PR002_g18037 [Phytophthora rubi]
MENLTFFLGTVHSLVSIVSVLVHRVWAGSSIQRNATKSAQSAATGGDINK